MGNTYHQRWAIPSGGSQYASTTPLNEAVTTAGDYPVTFLFSEGMKWMPAVTPDGSGITISTGFTPTGAKRDEWVGTFSIPETVQNGLRRVTVNGYDMGNNRILALDKGRSAGTLSAPPPPFLHRECPRLSPLCEGREEGNLAGLPAPCAGVSPRTARLPAAAQRQAGQTGQAGVPSGTGQAGATARRGAGRPACRDVCGAGRGAERVLQRRFAAILNGWWPPGSAPPAVSRVEPEVPGVRGERECGMEAFMLKPGGDRTMRKFAGLPCPLALAIALAGMATAGGPKVRDLPDGGYEMEFDAPIHQVGSWHEPREKGKAPFPKVVHAGGAVEFLDERGRRKAKVEVRENERVVIKKGFVVLGVDFYGPVRFMDLDGADLFDIPLSLPKDWKVWQGDMAFSEILGYATGCISDEEHGCTAMRFFSRGRLIMNHDVAPHSAGTWSPDGKYYAVLLKTGWRLALYSFKGGLLWMSPPDMVVETPQPVFSPDGRYVFAGRYEPERKGWLFDMAGNVVMELPTCTKPLFSDDARCVSQREYPIVGDATSLLLVSDLQTLETKRLLLNVFSEDLPGTGPRVGVEMHRFVRGNQQILARICRRPMALGSQDPPENWPWVPSIIDWRKGKMKKLPYGLSKYLPEDWTVEVEGKVLRRAKPEKLDE